MLQTPAFVFACLLCVIAIVGLTRVYDTAPPQAIGMTIVCGTLLILALTKFNKTFRGVIDSISTDQLICWHAIRAPIGAAFLVWPAKVCFRTCLPSVPAMEICSPRFQAC